MVTTLFLMDENTARPEFVSDNVSLRQDGNPNRILRLYSLMRQAMEKEKLFQEKGRRIKEAKRRQRVLENRFKYQLHRLMVWSLRDCYV